MQDGIEMGEQPNQECGRFFPVQPGFRGEQLGKTCPNQRVNQNLGVIRKKAMRRQKNENEKLENDHTQHG